jgi:hypothetical protein
MSLFLDPRKSGDLLAQLQMGVMPEAKAIPKAPYLEVKIESKSMQRAALPRTC